MTYAKPLAILAILTISGGSLYAFTYKTPEERIREAIISQNKAIEEANQAKVESYRSIKDKCEQTASGSSEQILAQLSECSKMEKPTLQKQIPLPTGSSGSIEGVSNNKDNVEKSTASVGVDTDPPSQTICTIGTGSHDVRPFAKWHPGVAGWKNNSVSGLSMGSKDLEKAFNEAGIKWYVGTYRPVGEGSRYYGFTDLENGMRAKLLVIKRSYKNATIKSYLKIWGTDSIVTSLDTSRNISSLSDSELISLIRSQITKESGKAMSDYVFNNVLTCK